MVHIGFRLMLIYWVEALARPKEGGPPGCSPTPPKRNKKKTNFVNTMISEVSRYLHLSLNQALKLVRDWLTSTVEH